MDGIKLAGSLAVAAGDALPIAYFFYVHFAHAHAGVAVYALGFVHFDGKQRIFVEETVKGAQGTQEPAEGPEQKDRQDQDGHQNHKTGTVNHVRTEGAARCQGQNNVGKRNIGTGKGTERTAAPQPYGSRKNGEHHYKKRQDEIFQITEAAGHFTALDLGRGDFIQQVLHQPQWTKPAADQPPESQCQQ